MLDGILDGYVEIRKKLIYLQKDIKTYISELYGIEKIISIKINADINTYTEYMLEMECKMNDGSIKTLEFNSRENQELFDRMRMVCTALHPID